MGGLDGAPRLKLNDITRLVQVHACKSAKLIKIADFSLASETRGHAPFSGLL